MKHITVIGSGSWGTALAVQFHKLGHAVTLWSWKEEEAAAILRYGEHREFLPGVPIPPSLRITTSREEALLEAEIVIAAIPSKFMRSTMLGFAPYFTADQVLVNVSKGLEDVSLYTLDKVLKECAPQCEVAVLSGPSHAEEVGRGVPTAVVVSAETKETAKMLQAELSGPTFRIYTNPDMLGVELGAAFKNIIALAAGISDGLGFGDNTKAALMTRGIAEVARLGQALGARTETFYGLAGMGDMIVTCCSMHSRNRRAGILLGQGVPLEQALEEVHQVVEGVQNAHAAMQLAERYDVEMPITQEMNRVLFEGADPRDAVITLMCRDKKGE